MPAIHNVVLRKRIIAHAVRNISAAKPMVRKLFKEDRGIVNKSPDSNQRQKHYEGPKFNNS